MTIIPFKFNKDLEPILKENPNRFTLFPIEYPEIYKLYKHSLSCFWVVEEIDLSQDKADWKRLTNDERFFIKNILGFFAGSDGMVNNNLILNFYDEIQIPEAKNLYSTQIMIEAIHSEMYSLLIDTYIDDPEEKIDTFNAVITNPNLKRKTEFINFWTDSTQKSFPERLIAFSVIEGLFFSGSFAAIYWIKTKSILPGLSLSNQFISRDESMHCESAILIYKNLHQKLPQNIIHDIFREATEIEIEFMTKSLPVALIGMNSDLMGQYIKFVADYWLVKLNYEKLYTVKNPFDFMDQIGIENKTNFFEAKVSDYAKAGVSVDASLMNFSLSEDF